MQKCRGWFAMVGLENGSSVCPEHMMPGEGCGRGGGWATGRQGFGGECIL